MLMGLVLGLAIYNAVLLDFPLPQALYRKLLGQSCTLRDLSDMDPTLGRSLGQLLAYDGAPPQHLPLHDMLLRRSKPRTFAPPRALAKRISLLVAGEEPAEQVFCQSFTAAQQGVGEVVTVALCEGGEDRMVTEENRREYVELYINYVLNSSVHRQARLHQLSWTFCRVFQGLLPTAKSHACAQFEAFARGFMMLCGGPAIHLFSATELERLVCGNPILDFSALQANARYEGGYTAEHRVMLPSSACSNLCLSAVLCLRRTESCSDCRPSNGCGRWCMSSAKRSSGTFSNSLQALTGRPLAGSAISAASFRYKQNLWTLGSQLP